MKKTIIQPHKSSLGIDANIAVIIVYAGMAVVSWISYLSWIAWAVPIVFFYLEKESKFVRYQSVQALVIGVVRAAIDIVLQIFIWILTPKDWVSAISYALGQGWGSWVLLGTVSTIIGIAITLIEAYILFKAYNWTQIELPVIGPIAEKASEKLSSININLANNSPRSKTVCPSCGQENPSGTGFCGGCGSKLEQKDPENEDQDQK